MADDLFEFKDGYNLPGMGTTEKVERAFKGVTKELGLAEVSGQMESKAAKLGHVLEYHGLANIALRKSVTFDDGMNKHMFFFDDKIVNAIMFFGGIACVLMSPGLLLPMLGVGAFYVLGDKFIKHFPAMQG